MAEKSNWARNCKQGSIQLWQRRNRLWCDRDSPGLEGHGNPTGAQSWQQHHKRELSTEEKRGNSRKPEYQERGISVAEPASTAQTGHTSQAWRGPGTVMVMEWSLVITGRLINLGHCRAALCKEVWLRPSRRRDAPFASPALLGSKLHCRSWTSSLLVPQGGEGTGTAGEGALTFRKPIWNGTVSVQKEWCHTVTCGNKKLIVPTLGFVLPHWYFGRKSAAAPEQTVINTSTTHDLTFYTMKHPLMKNPETQTL